MKASDFIGYARKAFAAGTAAAASGVAAVGTIQVNAPEGVVFPWWWYAIAAVVPYLLGFYVTYQTRNDPK